MSLVNLLSRVSTRERTMLEALVLVGFLIWLSVLWRNWDGVNERLRLARREQARQAVWMGDARRFERELSDTLSRLDAKSTLDAPTLVALVDDLARHGGLKHELGAPSTEEGEVFSRHTLRMTVKNVPLADLIAFERQLHTHYPYATLEDISISANKADPRLLHARLTVSSFLLRRGLSDPEADTESKPEPGISNQQPQAEESS